MKHRQETPLEADSTSTLFTVTVLTSLTECGHSIASKGNTKQFQTEASSF